MGRLTPTIKREIIAKCHAFSSSGLPGVLLPESLCRHSKSIHGRDYKLVAQYIVFIVWDYLTKDEKNIWKTLSKVYMARGSHVIMLIPTILFIDQVFHYTYCNSTGSVDDVKTACTSFVDSIKSGCPELSASKLKVHLLLHLPECVEQFGPTIRKGNHLHACTLTLEFKK